MHRRIGLVVIACLLAAGGLLAAGPASRADDTTIPTIPRLQDPTTQPERASTTTSLIELPRLGIIPLPNSGVAPQAPGDRGGWAQVTLFFLILTGMCVVFFMATRSARQRTRAKRIE